MCDGRLFLCFHRFDRFRRFDRFDRFRLYQCYRRFRRYRRFYRDPAPSSRPVSRACVPRIAKSNALHRDI